MALVAMVLTSSTFSSALTRLRPSCRSMDLVVIVLRQNVRFSVDAVYSGIIEGSSRGDVKTKVCSDLVTGTSI